MPTLAWPGLGIAVRQVSKQLSALVLSHHKQFMVELAVSRPEKGRGTPRPSCSWLAYPFCEQRVGELTDELSMTLVVCKNGRRLLSRATNDVEQALLVRGRGVPTASFSSRASTQTLLLRGGGWWDVSRFFSGTAGSSS